MATICSPLDREVSVVLRGLQGECNLSNVSLVATTGIEGRTLIRILQGQRPVTIGELSKLATALGTAASTIVHAAETRTDSAH